MFESHKWVTVPEGTLNEDGDLIDRDTKAVLIHGSDTIIDKDMEGTEFRDETITQWIIVYLVKKVLKLRKCTIDWTAVFGEDDGEN